MLEAAFDNFHRDEDTARNVFKCHCLSKIEFVKLCRDFLGHSLPSIRDSSYYKITNVRTLVSQGNLKITIRTRDNSSLQSWVLKQT
jgi:hypothetical protein